MTLAVSRVAPVLAILGPHAADVVDPEVLVLPETGQKGAELEGAWVEGLDEVEEHTAGAASRGFSEPIAFVRKSRVRHRLLDVDASTALEEPIDSPPLVRMGGDMEEIGVQLTELPLARDHSQSRGAGEISRSRSGIEAIDDRHFELNSGIVDQPPHVAVNAGDGDRRG